MAFQSSNALVNHQKKFCVNGDYGTKEKLETILKTAAAPPTMELGKSQLPGGTNNLMQARFRERAEMDIEQEKAFQLERYKEEKKKIKLEQMNKEAEYLEKLEQLQKLKEEELKEKVEKETIKRAVKNLEVDKIKILQEEKQMEKERIAQDANLLARRQRELEQQIDQLQNNIKETAKIYEEAERRPVDLPQMAQKISDQENLKRRMFEEKTERISELKARENNLIAERLNLDRLIDETRAGKLPDRDNVAKANDRISVGAQKHLNDIRGIQNFDANKMKQKLRDDEIRLQNLKNGSYEPQGLTRPMSKQMLAGATALQSPPSFEQNADDEEYNLMQEQQYAPALRVINERAQLNDNVRSQLEELPGSNQINFGNNPQAGDFGPRYEQDIQPEYSRQTLKQPLGAGVALPGMNPRVTTGGGSNQLMQHQFQSKAAPRATVQSAQNYMASPEHMLAQMPSIKTTATFGTPMAYSGPVMRGDFDDFLNSNFVQNQMRNVDLNEDERMLVHLTMMEADSLRMLNRIPPNSELYRFKLEQYKELSTQRAEAEKLIQETKLRKMKRALDMRIKEEDRRFENQRFVDDIRKQTTSMQLQKEGKIPDMQLVTPEEGLRDLNRKPNLQKNTTRRIANPADTGGYDPDNGFIIHWDYVFGIPKNQKFCQLVYAIRSGDESILDPQVVEPRAVRDQNVEKNQCIFYENNHIREIEPGKITNLIIEVQMPPSLSNPDEYTSLGWTFINLFDVNLELNRGKFKLPLYQAPIYQNILKEGVGILKPVMDCSILFRISYPWKDEFSNLKSNEPHINQRDYVIPSLHLKQASIPGVMSSNLFGEKLRPNNQVNESTRMYDEDVVNDLPPRAYPGTSRRQGAPIEAAPSTTTKPETPNDMVSKSKGFKVIIHKVADFKPNEKAKISLMVVSNQFLQRDDLDNDTRKSTTVHTTKGKDSIDGQGASDKRMPGNAVSWEETFTYFLSVPKRVREDRKDIFLVMRVYESGDELTGRNPNTSATMQGYQLKGWYCQKLNELNGKLVVGSFQENIYSPPEKSPPFDPALMTQITPSIEYTIEELTGATSRRKLD